MNPEDAVVIATYPDRIAAELAASWLEADQIGSVILADDAGGAAPFFQLTRGVRLLVAPEHEERAREVLESAESERE